MLGSVIAGKAFVQRCHNGKASALYSSPKQALRKRRVRIGKEKGRHSKDYLHASISQQEVFSKNQTFPFVLKQVLL